MRSYKPWDLTHRGGRIFVRFVIFILCSAAVTLAMGGVGLRRGTCKGRASPNAPSAAAALQRAAVQLDRCSCRPRHCDGLPRISRRLQPSRAIARVDQFRPLAVRHNVAARAAMKADSAAVSIGIRLDRVPGGCQRWHAYESMPDGPLDGRRIGHRACVVCPGSPVVPAQPWLT